MGIRMNTGIRIWTSVMATDFDHFVAIGPGCKVLYVTLLRWLGSWIFPCISLLSLSLSLLFFSLIHRLHFALRWPF